MKNAAKKLVAVVGLLALTVNAQQLPGYTRYWSETQALTRSPATPANATDGLLLDGVKYARISVCTASGQTLTAGTLRAWYYNPDRALWTRNVDGDLTISVTAATQRCQTFPDKETGVSVGRLLYACDSVTVSSGTTCSVDIKAFTLRGALMGK